MFNSTKDSNNFLYCSVTQVFYPQSRFIGSINWFSEKSDFAYTVTH